MSSTKFQPSTDFWIGLFMPLMLAAVIVPLVLLRAWVLATLWGWYVVPDDGARPLPPRPAPAPAPSAGEVARTLAGAVACALIAGAVAAIYSPWLAVLVVAPFVAVAGLEAGRWWRGRRA